MQWRHDKVVREGAASYECSEFIHQSPQSSPWRKRAAQQLWAAAGEPGGVRPAGSQVCPAPLSGHTRPAYQAHRCH